MLLVMDTEQAPVAVQPTEAAPVAGAENRINRAQEKAQIISQLSSPQAEIASPDAKPSLDATAEAGIHAAEADTAEEQPNKEVKNFRGRWDHLDDHERDVVKLVAKRGLSLTEAYHTVYGHPLNAAAPATNPGEIAGQSEETVDDGKVEGAESKAPETSVTSGNDAHSQWSAVTARNGVALPEGCKPGTELYDACAEEYQYLCDSGSPLVNDPQCAQKIATRMARLLGNKPSAVSPAKPGAVVQPPLPQVSPKRTVRPIPAGGNPVEAPVQTLERRVAGARTTGEMLALMKEYGTPIEALLKK